MPLSDPRRVFEFVFTPQGRLLSWSHHWEEGQPSDKDYPPTNDSLVFVSAIDEFIGFFTTPPPSQRRIT